MMFPIFEKDWPSGILIVLYFLLLGWTFVGVAIVSDIFMSAIDAITSKKKRVKVNNAKKGTDTIVASLTKNSLETLGSSEVVTEASGDRYVTVKVWNDTVANLTLMALGSSAPEIMLSCIEILANDMKSGELGPSTIVGSAAFNLLVIIAVCIVGIPTGESRSINDMRVYAVTATWSLLAYGWLYFILEVWTPNAVHWVEGTLTLVGFPVLVMIAYMADVGCFSERDENGRSVVAAEMSPDEICEVAAEIRRRHGNERITLAHMVRLIEAESNIRTKTSYAKHRCNSTRTLFSGKSNLRESPSMVVPFPDNVEDAKPTAPPSKLGGMHDEMEAESVEDERHPEVVIELASCQYAVLENVGTLTVLVERSGCLEDEAFVKYRTRDGTAKAGEDYDEKTGELTFAPGEVRQGIPIRIIDDTCFEDDEHFYLDIFEPSAASSTGPRKVVALGSQTTATITIVDDDDPGVLRFEHEEIWVEENDKDTKLELRVLRQGGSTGNITCQYKTESATAICPLDFEHVEGTLDFKTGQMSAVIPILIKSKGRYEKTENFRVIIFEPTNKASFAPDTDGGAESCVATIFIKPGERVKASTDRMLESLKVNWDKTRIGTSHWGDQFVAAIYCNGSKEEQQDASVGDWAFHVVSLPWKLVGACCPPTDYAGGWVCFVCSLMLIGGITCIVKDFAELFGCNVDFPPMLTAITFVAIGTSLPDTFASKSAATMDEHADASIGNVTGSNSVNVFLGIGMPWSLAAIYWACVGRSSEWVAEATKIDAKLLNDWPQGGVLVVKAGGLGVSVAIFSCCALVALLLLHIRRTSCGGELGGPFALKWVSGAFFVFLWLLYVFFSAVEAYRDW